jgi:hypothetical protein
MDYEIMHAQLTVESWLLTECIVDRVNHPLVSHLPKPIVVEGFTSQGNIELLISNKDHVLHALDV